jgi:hypothetical protein
MLTILPDDGALGIVECIGEEYTGSSKSVPKSFESDETTQMTASPTPKLVSDVDVLCSWDFRLPQTEPRDGRRKQTRTGKVT